MKYCWILATTLRFWNIKLLLWHGWKKYPVYSIDKTFSKDLNLLHVFKIVGKKPEKKYKKH